jgi:hypothetical protein
MSRLVKLHSAFQIRSQVLVGLRWFTYIDSIMAGTKATTSGAVNVSQ